MQLRRVHCRTGCCSICLTNSMMRSVWWDIMPTWKMWLRISCPLHQSTTCAVTTRRPSTSTNESCSITGLLLSYFYKVVWGRISNSECIVRCQAIVFCFVHCMVSSSALVPSCLSYKWPLLSGSVCGCVCLSAAWFVLEAAFTPHCRVCYSVVLLTRELNQHIATILCSHSCEYS